MRSPRLKDKRLISVLSASNIPNQLSSKSFWKQLIFFSRDKIVFDYNIIH